MPPLLKSPGLPVALAVSVGVFACSVSDADRSGEGLDLTVSGLALPNATVTARYGEQSAQTVADADGGYSIDISGAPPDAVVSITARGAGAQASIELATSLDALGRLVAAAGDDGVLDVDDHPGTRLDAFTTARYARIYELSGAHPSRAAVIDADRRSLEGAAAGYHTLAAALDRFIETPSMPLPVGFATTLALALSPADIVRHTDQLDGPHFDGLDADRQRVGATAAAVYRPFEPDAPKSYFRAFAAQRRDVVGFMGDGYRFAANGVGAYEQRGNFGRLGSTVPFTWGVEDGTLTLEYDRPNRVSFAHMNGTLAAELLGDPRWIDPINESGISQVRFERIRTHLYEVPRGLGNDWVLMGDVFVYRLAEAYPFNVPDVEVVRYAATTFRPAETIATQPFTDAQFRGHTWALQVPYAARRNQLADDFQAGETILAAALVTFHDDAEQTVSHRDAEGPLGTATWSLTDGRVEIAYADGTTVGLNRVTTVRAQVGALTTLRFQGATYTRYQAMVQVDPSFMFSEQLFRSDTQYWQNLVRRAAYDGVGAGPALFEVFGYQFRAGQQAYRYLGVGEFERAPFAYSIEGGQVVIERYRGNRGVCTDPSSDPSCRLRRRRVWLPLRNDDGWVYVFEQAIWRPFDAVYNHVTQQYERQGVPVRVADYDYFFVPQVNGYYRVDTQ